MYECISFLCTTQCCIEITWVTAHWAAAMAVLATVAALTLLPSVRNTSLEEDEKNNNPDRNKCQ